MNPNDFQRRRAQTQLDMPLSRFESAFTEAGQGLFDGLSGRADRLVEDADKQAAGTINWGERGLRGTGEVIGAIGDVVGAGVGLGFDFLVPDEISDPAGEWATENILNPIASSLMETQTAKDILQYAEDNPEIARNVGSAFEVLGAAPMFRVARGAAANTNTQFGGFYSGKALSKTAGVAQEGLRGAGRAAVSSLSPTSQAKMRQHNVSRGLIAQVDAADKVSQQASPLIREAAMRKAIDDAENIDPSLQVTDPARYKRIVNKAEKAKNDLPNMPQHNLSPSQVTEILTKGKEAASYIPGALQYASFLAKQTGKNDSSTRLLRTLVDDNYFLAEGSLRDLESPNILWKTAPNLSGQIPVTEQLHRGVLGEIKNAWGMNNDPDAIFVMFHPKNTNDILGESQTKGRGGNILSKASVLKSSKFGKKIAQLDQNISALDVKIANRSAPIEQQIEALKLKRQEKLNLGGAVQSIDKQIAGREKKLAVGWPALNKRKENLLAAKQNVSTRSTNLEGKTEFSSTAELKDFIVSANLTVAELDLWEKPISSLTDLQKKTREGIASKRRATEKAMAWDEKAESYIISDSYASSAKVLGGVHQTTSIDRKGNVSITVSDEHDMFGIVPPGTFKAGKRLLSVYPPVTANIFKGPLKFGSDKTIDSKRVTDNIAEMTGVPLPERGYGQGLIDAGTRQKMQAIQNLKVKPTAQDYGNVGLNAANWGVAGITTSGMLDPNQGEPPQQ